jgi:hypothetical protein
MIYRARFSQARTFQSACEAVLDELRRLGADPAAAVLSTNVGTRQGRLPRSLTAQPADRGVAVYFVLSGRDQVLACDKWDRVEDNLYAIARHIGALRAQSRYGVGTVEQAFQGYLALPPKEPWWSVLKVSPDAHHKDIERAYQREARRVHPDHGGSAEAMARLNAAREEARLQQIQQARH